MYVPGHCKDGGESTAVSSGNEQEHEHEGEQEPIADRMQPAAAHPGALAHKKGHHSRQRVRNLPERGPRCCQFSGDSSATGT